MKKSFKFNGQDILGEDVEFESERENWNTYILHDGTKLKLKAVVGKIVRLDAWKENGEPLYLVESSNILMADVPESLKKSSE